MTGVKRFPKRKRRRFITTVEMPLFIRALELDESDYARHAVWLLLLTGMRMSEVLKAKWDNVDWDMGTLFVGLTKNGEPLLAPLSDLALGALENDPKSLGQPLHHLRTRSRHSSQGSAGDVGADQEALRIDEHSDSRYPPHRRLLACAIGVSLHLIGDVLNHRNLDHSGLCVLPDEHRRDALSGHADKVLKLGAPHLLRKPNHNHWYRRSSWRRRTMPRCHRQVRRARESDITLIARRSIA